MKTFRIKARIVSSRTYTVTSHSREAAEEKVLLDSISDAETESFTIDDVQPEILDSEEI